MTMTVLDRYLERYRQLRSAWYVLGNQYHRDQAIRARCDWLLVVSAAKVKAAKRAD